MLVGGSVAWASVWSASSRTGAVVSGGGLIVKGLTMFAPVEAQLDALLEPSGLLIEYGFKGLAWGATGALTGYGAHSFLARMKHAGSEILSRCKSTPAPQAPSPQELAHTTGQECRP